MSSFLDKMERKFGRYAIHNLMLYVSILYVIGYFVWRFNPVFFLNYLSLDMGMVFKGQVWRLVTFLMMPSNQNILLLAIYIYFYNFLGRTLEAIWGAFRFNLYYISGIILTIIGALIMHFVGNDISMYYVGTTYVNLSMFMAFAVNIPDMRVLLMFLIPIKVRWIAYFDAAYMIYLLVNNIMHGYYALAMSIFVSMLNFVVFFLIFLKKGHSPKQFIRRQQFKRAYNGGTARGYQGQGPAYGGNYSNSSNQNVSGQAAAKKITRHHCSICGRTELDGDELEFRFCSKCNGNYEYCQDHLFTHTHVQ